MEATDNVAARGIAAHVLAKTAGRKEAADIAAETIGCLLVLQLE
jgi:hypothetical protein